MPLPTPAASATSSIETQLAPRSSNRRLRGTEDPLAIARRVGPLDRLGGLDWKLERFAHTYILLNGPKSI